MGDRTSLPATHSNGTATPAKERRKHRRREPRELVYIDLGPDNCGFILDVCEGGISFKGISSLHDGEILKVRFRLPGTDLSMEAEGRFVRPGNATNSSVLKFLDLAPEVRTQIREWVATAEQDRPALPKKSAIPAVPAAPTVPALPVATPRLFERPIPTAFESPMPVASDGISPLSSILAHAIAKNSDPAAFSPSTHPDALDALALKISSNSPKPPPAAAEPPEASDPPPPENPPIAANHSAPTLSLRDQPANPDVKSAEWPKEPFELTIRPTPKAWSEAALATPAKAAYATKGSPISGFTAGIVVGCVVLASVGGGLVATGRLRLVKPSSPAGIAASAAPAVSNADGASVSMPGRAQTAPLSAATAPTATAPVRKEPARKESTLKPIVEKRPAAASTASSGRVQNTAPAAAGTEALRRSEQTRRADPTGSVEFGMSRPVEQAPEAPVSAEAPALSFPTGATQSLPELGAHAPEVVSQVSVPSGGQETFASPQIEQHPAPAKKTTKASQSSNSVFAAPDPSGAKPSSVDPAKLLQYVEPVYPEAARAAKIQGNVDVLATIGKDGVPRALQAVSGDPRLAPAAMAAISNWRYRPAMLNGQPEESLITITVKFAL